MHKLNAQNRQGRKQSGNIFDRFSTLIPIVVRERPLASNWIAESLRLWRSMTSSGRESRATFLTACVMLAISLANLRETGGSWCNVWWDRWEPRSYDGWNPERSLGRVVRDDDRERRTRRFDRRPETECGAARAKARNIVERVGSGCHPSLLSPTKGMQDPGAGDGTGERVHRHDDSLGSTSGMFGASAH